MRILLFIGLIEATAHRCKCWNWRKRVTERGDWLFNGPSIQTKGIFSFLYIMDLNNNQTTIISPSSTYCGLYKPRVSWVVGDSGFHMILGLLTVVASFPTALLNAFIILAIKQRRELQKPSNILLSSLAVTDLLVGAVSMPTTATIDFFRMHRVSFENTCMLGLVNAFFMPLLFTATLHHVTIIAWERYVAVQKWRDYKRIITNGRFKKIAIFTWLSALFPTAVYFSLRVFLISFSPGGLL